MKIDGKPGEFGFRALYNYVGIWEITEGVFFTEDEVAGYFNDKPTMNYLWPIEVEPNGQIVYVPTKEELL